MVSKIKELKDITWYRSNSPLPKTNLSSLKKIPFSFPAFFLELLKICDGGRIKYEFKYYHIYHERIFGAGISIIYGITSSEYNIIEEYENPPEFFPKNLLAFGEDGGGNRICFDYRQDVKSIDPPVVYWTMGFEEGKDISFLANNFAEFLTILEEPESLDDFLRKYSG